MFRTYLVTSITHLDPVSKLSKELTNSIDYLDGNFTLHYGYQVGRRGPRKNATKNVYFRHKMTKQPALESMSDQLNTLTYGICSPEPHMKGKVIHKRQAMLVAGILFAYTTAKTIINSLFNPMLNAPQHVKIENQEIALEHMEHAMNHLKKTHEHYNELLGVNFALWRLSMALNILTNAIKDIIRPNHQTGIGHRLIEITLSKKTNTEHFLHHTAEYLTHIEGHGEHCASTKLYTTLHMHSYKHENITVLNRNKYISDKEGHKTCHQAMIGDTNQGNIIINYPIAEIHRRITLCSNNKISCKTDTVTAYDICDKVEYINIVESIIVPQRKLNLTVRCKDRTTHREVAKYANIKLVNICSYTMTSDEIQIHIAKTITTKTEAFQKPLEADILQANLDIPSEDPEPSIEQFARETNTQKLNMYIIVSVHMTITVITIVITITLILQARTHKKVTKQ